MFKRISFLLAAFAFSASAQAVPVDFTDAIWKTSINGNTNATLDIASIGKVRLSASGGYLTFNSGRSERRGCSKSTGGSLLACGGDGIGIKNDEISQGGKQKITVSFLDAPVNITNIYLLDLFANDNGVKGRNETAVISSGSDTFYYTAFSSAVGGFYNTGFSGQGITSLVFSGNRDWFSDYALAGIEISPVPLPGAAILFGSALLGFFGFKRRRAS